jgi:hypothetical protein
MEGYELRMYGLVPYNISPIQQAIQFGHAVVEYGLENFNEEEYQNWAKNWKTFIILNGGTTNVSSNYNGTLNLHLETLKQNGIKVATFYEPDLGNQLTAIVFIVDERVFNKKKYPNYVPEKGFNNLWNYVLEFFQTKTTQDEYNKWKENFNDTEENVNKIIFLREFLNQFKLA